MADDLRLFTPELLVVEDEARLCPDCGELKSVKAFDFMAQAPNTYLPYCRSCKRRHTKQIHAVNYELWSQRQGGRCRLCSSLPGRRRLHIDIDHNTGTLRGLLCVRCNVGLGMFRDNVRLMLKAADYLLEYA